jgi:hypothetical protein
MLHRYNDNGWSGTLYRSNDDKWNQLVPAAGVTGPVYTVSVATVGTYTFTIR